MRVLRSAEAGGLKFHVHEASVSDIRAWLKGASQGGGDVIDALLFDEFDPQMLLAMTDLTAELLDTLTPSELRDVAARCREVNADFFVMRQRMAAAQQTLLAGLSNKPS